MNEENISKFLDYLESEGLSKLRIMKYRYTLGVISEKLGKDFKKCSREDLVKFVGDIQRSDYELNTKRDYKVVIKRFWKWLKPVNDDEKAYPREVRWIKATIKKREEKKIKTEDVLTEDEVYKLIDASPTIRDKAIISFLYESASRIGEITNLKIGDVHFDSKGYYFTTIGKTGEIYKRVCNERAVKLLKDWLNEHPLKNDATAPLWIVFKRTSKGGYSAMGYGGFHKMLRQVGELSKIKKKFNPHIFRHAWITEARVRKHIPDAIIEKVVGWVAGSDMFSTYQHDTKNDVDNALIQASGLKEQQEKAEKMEKIDDVLKELWVKNPKFRNIVMKAIESKI